MTERLSTYRMDREQVRLLKEILRIVKRIEARPNGRGGTLQAAQVRSMRRGLKRSTDALDETTKDHPSEPPKAQ